MNPIKHELDLMLARSVTLHGWTYKKDAEGNEVQVDFDAANKEFLRTLAAAEPDPKAQAKMIIDAWEDKSGTLQRALNAIRVEQVGNFIASESVFKSAFFESVTLRDDEEPKIKNDTEQEIQCGHIGEDGTPDKVRIVRPEAKTDIALRVISSKIVKYKTLDVYQGRVDGLALKTINIARDLTFQLDLEHRNLLFTTPALGGCFGAFSYEQARTNKSTRLFLAHSGVKTIHLPSTNDIANSTGAAASGQVAAAQRVTDYETSASTGFRIAVLAAITDYADRWGNLLPGGGRLMASGEIIVPASDIINIAKSLTPTANTGQEMRIQEEVNRQGYTTVNYLGKTWKFIGDHTIDKGVCYPRFNLLPGRTYDKPSMAKEIVKTDEVENWESRQQMRVYGAYIISQYRPRAVRIAYT